MCDTDMMTICLQAAETHLTKKGTEVTHGIETHPEILTLSLINRRQCCACVLQAPTVDRPSQ